MSIRRLALACLPILAACSESLEGPAPKPATVAPELVCTEQLTTAVTVRGSGFSPLPVGTLTGSSLELPAVTLIRRVDLAGERAGGEKAIPAATHLRWVSQQELQFDVSPELGVEPGLYGISIANRNGEEAVLPDALVAIPRPVVERIEPDLLCGEKGNSFLLTGSGFLRLADGTIPTVTLASGDDARTLQPAELSACAALPGSSGAELCGSARLEVPEDTLAPGRWSVVLTNPAPAGCASTDEQLLTVVPEPTVGSVEPDLACLADGSVSVTLRGEGFLVVDGVAPQVAIGERSYASAASDCAPVEAMRETVESCATLTAVVGQGDLPAGEHLVVVTNPAPADCASDDTVAWTVVDAPVVTAVDPAAVCMDGAGDDVLILTGAGFLEVDGTPPTVRIRDVDFAAAVDDATCATLDGLRENVRRCTGLTVTVPAGTFDPGTYDVAVVNPPPAACVSSTPATVRFAALPVVTSVMPAKMCTEGGTLLVQGDGFEPGAVVTIDGAPAEAVSVQSPTELLATFPGGQVLGGPYDLVVANAPACEATLPDVVTVVAGPQLFFADPPVVYDAINTQVLLYATGVSDSVESVSIRLTGTAGEPTVVAHGWSEARPNRVQIVVPAGTPPGTYDVFLSDVTDCEASLIGGLEVTGTLSVSVAAIDPPFGWTSSDTAVTIRAADPIPAPEVGFQPVPRLYLSPANPTPDSVATPLTSADVLSASTATAVVPDGLAPDDYDLIVVNPDGTVGLLEDAFRVTDLPPPTVTTVSPGSIANSSVQRVTVFGAELREPEVTLFCKDPGTGTIQALATSEVSSDASQVVTDVDATALAGGAICVVRVTNPDQQTHGEFSALVITNPAQNLSVTTAGPDLLVARHAPASLGAAATNAARFLFAIGGDDGTALGVRSSVESAPVDVYGAPSDFVEQRHGLVTARAHAGAARVGRFLYVAGGTDGLSPLATIERAYLLDPKDRVELTDLEIRLVEAGGLAPGVYSYRVAPIRAASHAKNPGGEELPSEPFPVILPEVDGRGLAVRLTWSISPGASGYRIYRSATAGDTGTERLIAEVADGATNTLTDDGLVAGDELPLPLGSTGVWHVAATLNEARLGAGVTAIASPGDPSLWHLYVAGGLGGTGPLSSIETVAIAIASDGGQTVAAPEVSTAQLGTARWNVGMYGVTHDVSTVIPAGEPWIYVAGGAVNAAGTSLTGAVEAFAVGTTGGLGAGVAAGTMQARAGFGAAAANDFLHAFGGVASATSVISAAHCDGTNCGGGRTVPELANWNSTGNLNFTARMEMGTAIQSGFIYLIGGSDGSVALRSTRLTHW